MYIKVRFIRRDDVVDVDLDTSGHSKEAAQAKARLGCNAVDLSLSSKPGSGIPHKENGHA